jgi:hypothetical protein
MKIHEERVFTEILICAIVNLRILQIKKAEIFSVITRLLDIWYQSETI